MSQSEDFSLKWFGIPDAVVVARWEKMPPPISKAVHDRLREDRRRISAIYKLASEGVSWAQLWVNEDHLSRITR